jgi:hypothetical protein
LAQNQPVSLPHKMVQLAYLVKRPAYPRASLQQASQYDAPPNDVLGRKPCNYTHILANALYVLLDSDSEKPLGFCEQDMIFM